MQALLRLRAVRDGGHRLHALQSAALQYRHLSSSNSPLSGLYTLICSVKPTLACNFGMHSIEPADTGLRAKFVYMEKLPGAANTLHHISDSNSGGREGMNLAKPVQARAAVCMAPAVKSDNSGTNNVIMLLTLPST